MQADSKPDARVHLHDMLESAKQVMRYVAGQTFDDFWSDHKTRDAVAMRLTVIGEAARHVTSVTATAIPNVPFHQIRGLRNRIAHTYEQVDFKEVWKITQHDLKPLITELEKYLLQLKQTPAPALRPPTIPPPAPGNGPRIGF